MGVRRGRLGRSDGARPLNGRWWGGVAEGGLSKGPARNLSNPPRDDRDELLPGRDGGTYLRRNPMHSGCSTGMKVREMVAPPVAQLARLGGVSGLGPVSFDVLHGDEAPCVVDSRPHAPPQVGVPAGREGGAACTLLEPRDDHHTVRVDDDGRAGELNGLPGGVELSCSRRLYQERVGEHSSCDFTRGPAVR